MTHHLSRCTLANSPSVLEHLAEQAGVPRSRLRLVRGGIDAGPIRSAQPICRRALGLNDLDRMILWVGRLDPVKGLNDLLMAFDRIANEHRAHLLLAGDGPLRGPLAARIAGMQAGRSVHLLGPRNDVPGLLKTADVFAFPSRTEGLPNALLEAMAAGCPIVTTDVCGCRDLVTNGRTGLVVPYGDPERLAAAIDRLLTDPSLARRLGAAAADEVSSMWHWSRTVDAYAALYAEAGALSAAGSAGTGRSTTTPGHRAPSL